MTRSDCAGDCGGGDVSRRTFLAAGAAALSAAAMETSGAAAGTGNTAMSQQLPMVTFQRRIPVRHEVDVCVIGGGPAGMAAAVTAARQKCRVFMAERHTCLGGMGTAGLVPIFCDLTDRVNFVAGGFGREVYERLHDAGGTGPYDRRDNPFAGTSINAEVLKRVYDTMAVEAGVDFTFQTTCIGVETDGRRIAHIICAAKSGIFAVRAGIYIDCTGDGDVCAWAGAPFEKGDADGNMMPGTLCSLWCDIDWETVRKSGLNAEKELPRAFRDKVFTIEDRHLPGIWPVGRGIGGGNVGHTFGVDATDERSTTRALVWGRKLVLEYERYYKNYLKGYERMQLVGTGSLLGVRETRRIMGDYVLNLEDFRKRAVFADEIGRFCYPVDIHAAKPDAKSFAQFEKEFQTLRYKPGENYGIPYRCLIPRNLDNTLVAGRCISCDRYIQGSVRVMPGCFITGQAAGMAAAIAVQRRSDTRGVPVGELQRRLKAIGAYLPNCA